MADTPQGQANTPTSKQIIHSLYFVRLRPYEDCMMKLEEAEDVHRRISQKCFLLGKELGRKKYLHLNRIKHESLALSLEDGQYEQVLRNKMRELKLPFHAALAKLQHPHNNTTKMEENLCSSEKELNFVMKRLRHCLHHKKDTSVKERQVLREMKLLEGTREEVVAKSLKEKSDYEYSFGQEKAIQEKNSYFFQGEESLSDVKKKAGKIHIGALKRLSHLQVEKFMAQWNSSKTFRQKYIRTSTLPSLESRELCSDGRLRNPDEKIMISEAEGTLETKLGTAHEQSKTETLATKISVRNC